MGVFLEIIYEAIETEQEKKVGKNVWGIETVFRILTLQKSTSSQQRLRGQGTGTDARARRRQGRLERCPAARPPGPLSQGLPPPEPGLPPRRHTHADLRLLPPACPHLPSRLSALCRSRQTLVTCASLVFSRCLSQKRAAKRLLN